MLPFSRLKEAIFTARRRPRSAWRNIVSHVNERSGPPLLLGSTSAPSAGAPRLPPPPWSCCDLPRSRILLAFFAFWKLALASRFLLGYCLLRDAIARSDGLTTPGKNANEGDKLFSCCFNLRFERLQGIPGLRSGHSPRGRRPRCVNKQANATRPRDARERDYQYAEAATSSSER